MTSEAKTDETLALVTQCFLQTLTDVSPVFKTVDMACVTEVPGANFSNCSKHQMLI